MKAESIDLGVKYLNELHLSMYSLKDFSLVKEFLESNHRSLNSTSA